MPTVKAGEGAGKALAYRREAPLALITATVDPMMMTPNNQANIIAPSQLSPSPASRRSPNIAKATRFRAARKHF